MALFVAHPAAARSGVAEDDGLGLLAEDRPVEERPVIDLALAGRALAAGAVEPLLEDLAVVGVDVLQGADEDLVVFRRAVTRVVPVPGRDIDAELQARLAAGVREFAQDIAFPVAPATLGDGMGAFGIGPKAESVVVLGRDDHALEAGRLGDRHPLAAVQRRRLEHVLALLAIPPLLAGEGVGSEMQEEVGLHFLPFPLIGTGNGAAGRGGLGRAARPGQGQQRCQEKPSSHLHKHKDQKEISPISRPQQPSVTTGRVLPSASRQKVGASRKVCECPPTIRSTPWSFGARATSSS